MRDFTVSKRVDIWHGDGWGVRLESNVGEFGNYRLSYVDDIDDKGERVATQIELWPEAARHLVNELAKMLDEEAK